MQKFTLNGILPIYKLAGISSFDVIRQIKRQVPVKKIGHGGTLDLLAEGTLPVLLGEATKAFDYLLKSPKEYIATLQFGAVSSTDDAEGEKTERKIEGFDIKRVAEALPKFRGKITQIPPRYSALKYNGKKGYELARQNKDFTPKPRSVIIYTLEILDHDTEKKQCRLRVECSSGTYIRALARDIGEDLGWGAYLAALTRTRNGGIRLEDCLCVEDITPESITSQLISLNHALASIPAIEWVGRSDYIKQGRPLQESLLTDRGPLKTGIYRLTRQGKLLALIEKGENWRYLRVFHEIP